MFELCHADWLCRLEPCDAARYWKCKTPRCFFFSFSFKLNRKGRPASIICDTFETDPGPAVCAHHEDVGKFTVPLCTYAKNGHRNRKCLRANGNPHSSFSKKLSNRPSPWLESKSYSLAENKKSSVEAVQVASLWNQTHFRLKPSK